MANQGPPGQPPNYGPPNYGPPGGYSPPPGYGYPPPRPPKKSNTPLILIIIGVAVLTLFGGCAALVAVVGSTPDVKTGTAPPVAEPSGRAGSTAAGGDDAPSQEPTSAPPSDAAVGDTITLQGNDPGLKVSVTVTKVVAKATPANDFIKPKAGNRYVAIEVKLANTGQAVYDDAPTNGALLIDDQGQQYRITFGDVREGVSLNGSVTVNVGDSRKGVIVFEVPESVKLAKFQFGLNSGFADQKGEWTIS